MLAKTIVAPVDRIKILYQVTSTPFRMTDLPNVLSRIVKREGVTALWRGNGATLVRVFPYAGIQFMVFNQYKSYCLSNKKEGEGMTTVESLVAGSVAGGMSVLFTYPLDLTRAQLAVSKKQSCGNSMGFLDVIGMNYRNGVRFFFQELGFVSVVRVR